MTRKPANRIAKVTSYQDRGQTPLPRQPSPARVSTPK
jgi:hypothetical protein